MYLQIMWKFLEQRSFHLSESEYSQQLDAVAEYLTLWRVAQTVRAGIRTATPRGPGYTGGGGARAVGVLHPSHKHLQLDMHMWQCSAVSHVCLSNMHAMTLQDCHSRAYETTQSNPTALQTLLHSQRNLLASLALITRDL